MARFFHLFIPTVLWSCNLSGQDDFVIGEQKQDTIEAFLVPSTIQEDKDGNRYKVVFLQSARGFYISGNMEKAARYVGLIRWGIETSIPLTVMLSRSSNEIFEVRKAPEDVVDSYRENSEGQK